MRSLDLPSLTFITSFPGPTLQANKLCLHQARGTVLPQCPPPGQIHKRVFCPKAAWLPLEVFHTASSVILHYLGSSDLFFSYSANLPISLVCICFYKFHCQLIHLVLLWITVIKTSRSHYLALSPIIPVHTLLCLVPTVSRTKPKLQGLSS